LAGAAAGLPAPLALRAWAAGDALLAARLGCVGRSGVVAAAATSGIPALARRMRRI
jgi:hypothetical protein